MKILLGIFVVIVLIFLIILGTLLLLLIVDLLVDMKLSEYLGKKVKERFGLKEDE